MNSINNFKNILNKKLIELNCIQRISDKLNKRINNLNELINKSSFNNVIKNELNINFDNNINICKINIEKYVKNEKEENVRNNEYLKCFWPKCQYKAKNSFHLKNHKLIHLNVKQFKCDFSNCSEVFKTKRELIEHKINHLNNDRYSCVSNDLNNKTFEQKNSLNNDKKIDFNECNKLFDEKTNSISHKLIHLSIKQIYRKIFVKISINGFLKRVELCKIENGKHFEYKK